MTLTQVSTWFANARRRLKKENKMTWVPKNRSSDASNAGSKKTDDEDDDDVTSHLSQDNDCKSDLEHGIDSDDSDIRKVTSTNISDDITTTTDLKESPNEFSNERCSVTSETASHRQHSEDREFRPQLNDDQLRSNYGPFDHKEKTWTSMGEGADQKTSETINHQGLSSPYPSSAGYLGSSTMLPQPNAPVNSSIPRANEMCPPNELKYAHEWTPTSYAAYPSEPSDTQRASDHLETSQSPSHIAEAKPNHSRNAFAINPVSESTSPTAPSYAQTYQHPFPQTIEYYRNADRLGVEPSYFPHNDISSRGEIKSERLSGSSYPGNRDSIQPKTPTYSVVPSPSHSATDSTSSNPKPLYQHNLSPQYYPNVKLVKSVPPTTTSYTGAFFQQDNFNQPPSVENNMEYNYPRKGFYSPEAPGYHLPSSTSPRK